MFKQKNRQIPGFEGQDPVELEYRRLKALAVRLAILQAEDDLAEIPHAAHIETYEGWYDELESGASSLKKFVPDIEEHIDLWQEAAFDQRIAGSIPALPDFPDNGTAGVSPPRPSGLRLAMDLSKEKEHLLHPGPAFVYNQLLHTAAWLAEMEADSRMKGITYASHVQQWKTYYNQNAARAAVLEPHIPDVMQHARAASQGAYDAKMTQLDPASHRSHRQAS